MLIRYLTAVFFVFTLAPGMTHAQVRITDDRGGRIGTYVDRYQDLRSSGEHVIIDGFCASSCTIVFGAVPAERIFFTRRAVLGFHAAWNLDANGRAVTNREATKMLYAMYPKPVRRWIAARGGLKSKLILMKANSIAAMGYREYRPTATYANAAPNW